MPITKTAITSKIKTLKQTYGGIATTSETMGLKARLISAYCSKVLASLDSIFSGAEDEDLLLKSCEEFLTTNWDFVKGTMLCYTALPQSGITNLVCDIATFVKESHSASDENSVISWLMPTVSVTSLSGDYPDLNTLKIETVLNTHILGQKSQYLIPVKLLSSLETLTSPKAFFNAYHAFEKHSKSMAILTADETSRIFEHSSLSQAIVNAIKDLDNLISDENNLLGRLRHLSARLYLNSKNGLGQETSAGGGIYSEIINFNRYYDGLSDTQKTAMPALVRKEITTLLGFASDGTKSTQIGSCLATRYAALQGAIKGNEGVLGGISHSGDNKKNLITQAQKQLQLLKKSFSDELDRKIYAGHDLLSLNRVLFERLEVALSMSHPQDVDCLLRLNRDEITLLCQNEAFKKQVVKAISSIDNLVVLCLTGAPDKLRALLVGVSKNIASNLVKSPQDLAALLVALGSERTSVVCDSLGGHFLSVIKSGEDFGFLLWCLNEAQRTVVCELLKGHFSSFIKSGVDFVWVLRGLNEAQRTVVCESLQGDFSSFIKSGGEFGLVLRYLNETQCKVVCESLKGHFSSVIKSGEEFGLVLQHLKETQRTVVCELLKGHFSSFIKSVGEFIWALGYLNEAQRTVVCESLKGHFSSFIKSGLDFGGVLRYLNEAQCKVVCESLKGDFSSFIKSGLNFGRVLRYLNEAQCKVVCESLEGDFSSFIKSGEDFGGVFRCLNEAQRAVVFESLQGRFSSFIKSGRDFGRVLQYLNEAQRKVVFESLQGRFSSFIKSGRDFGGVLRYLNEAQCKVVCESLEGDFSSFIKSGEDFAGVFRYLNEAQCKVVFESLEGDFSSFIKSGMKLHWVFRYLNEAQRTVVCELLKGHFSSFIKSDSDLLQVLLSLNEAQRRIVLESLKGSFLSLIKSAESSGLKSKGLLFLTEWQRTRFFDSLKGNFSSVIKSGEEFGLVFQFLNEAQCKVVCKSAASCLDFMKAIAKEFMTEVLERIPESSAKHSRLSLCLNKTTSSLEEIKSVLRDFVAITQEHRHFFRFSFFSNPPTTSARKVVSLLNENDAYKVLLRSLVVVGATVDMEITNLPTEQSMSTSQVSERANGSRVG